MAQVGVNPAIQQLSDIQTQLETQGIDMQQIDAWINSQGIDSILSDNRLVAQYFTAANRALQALTEPNYDDPFASLSAQTPPPGDYAGYFGSDRDTSDGVAYADYFPEGELFNPQWLVDNGYFSPTMAQAYQNLMDQGMFSGDGAAASGSAPTGTKGMSTGGTTVKGLVNPAAAPGPVSGAAPTGGGLPAAGTGGTTFTANEWEFVNSLENGVQKEWLQDLLGDAEMQRGVVANLVNSIQDQRQTMRSINDTISGLDPTNPQDAHQIMVLNQERGMLQDSMREKMDMLQRAQHFLSERVTLFKGLIDVDNRTRESIIRNMRQ